MELAGIARTCHWANPDVGRLVPHLYQSQEVESRKFATDVADQHPDRATRGRAALTIGELAKWELTVEVFPLSNKGKRELTDARRKEAQGEAATFLAKAVSEYADVTLANTSIKIGPRAAAALAGLENLANLQPGRVARDIQGQDLEGKPLKLSEHKGKVVLLVFWASWCGPCMADVPHELELIDKFKDRPFVILGVNGDEVNEKALAAQAKYRISWRSYAADQSGRRSSIPAMWDVESWPTTYVIDHEGIIRHRNLRRNELDQPLSELIIGAEKAAKGK